MPLTKHLVGSCTASGSWTSMQPFGGPGDGLVFVGFGAASGALPGLFPMLPADCLPGHLRASR